MLLHQMLKQNKKKSEDGNLVRAPAYMRNYYVVMGCIVHNDGGLSTGGCVYANGLLNKQRVANHGGPVISEIDHQSVI